MKVAILGVGSFVFGPSVLHDAIVQHRMADVQIALFDPNRPMMELMAGVGRAMAHTVGIAANIACHDTQSAAIDSADFVVSSAAVQVQRRFASDVDIIRRIYPEHLITEFGGVAGISYSLRQIALMSALAGDMRRRCPDAWLLTSSNPLPRVVQAVHQLGIKVAGFCSNSSQVFQTIGKLLLGVQEPYPWPSATGRYAVHLAGVNHFTWLLGLIDRQNNANVLDTFIHRLKEDPSIARDRPMSLELLEEFGVWGPNNDAHMADFLPPGSHVTSLEHNTHGNADERQARQQRLSDVADGKADYHQIMDHRAWEMPMDFVAGLARGKSASFNSLNLPNTARQLPQLPEQVIVETPVQIIEGQMRPTTSILPDRVAAACRSTAHLTEIIARAALEKSRDWLRNAVELDPTILDKPRGMQALMACMQAHADLIGNW